MVSLFGRLRALLNPEGPPSRRTQIGAILVEQQKISDLLLQEAIDGKLAGELLGQTLVRLRMVSERDVVRAVAQQTGVATAVDDDLIPDEAAREALPYALAAERHVLPLSRDGRSLTIAFDTMPSADDLAYFATRTGCDVVPVLAERTRIDAAIVRTYQRRGDRSKPIGVYLVERGTIERPVLEYYLDTPDRTGRRLFERLVDDGFVERADVREIVASYFGITVVDDIGATSPVDKAVLAAIAPILEDHPNLAVLAQRGRLLVIAAVPIETDVIETIAERTGRPVAFVVTRPSVVAAARREIDTRYRA